MKDRLKPTRYYSNKQEKYVANKVDGYQTVNSGATRFKKGDISCPDILIECKTSVTEKNSFSVKKDILDKLKQESFSMGKDNCVLVFNFGPGTKNYYILDEKYFLELYKKGR